MLTTLTVMQVGIIVLIVAWMSCLTAQAEPLECRRSWNGYDYAGTQSNTRHGLTCQPWTSQYPHAHNYTSAQMFPDVTLEDASNYCRNPDGSWRYFGTWCFTTDPDVRWQYCSVPMCSGFPDCRRTKEGTEYRGHLAVTSSGMRCDRWPPGEGEKNYCRNPDGRESGPYCHVGSAMNESRVESCDIPFCKPAMHCKRTSVGREYSGKISVTAHGRTCQRWADQYPHPHNHTNPSYFPGLSVKDAHNYCRNPDDTSGGPWCYTKDPETRRETCGIRTCQDCKLSNTGRDYSGSLSQVPSGGMCERWDAEGREDMYYDVSRYPDLDISSAENYCRNPDSDAQGPWCFSGGEKTYCNIPMCENKDRDTVHPPKAKHIIHIGVDGLRPDCIAGAIGGAPNMLQRLTTEGTYTLTRATTCLQTSSSPAWSTTLCGMGIEATGVTSNAWLPPWRGYKQPITPVTGNEHELPCIFHELKAQDPNIRTGFFYDWEWFRWMGTRGYPNDIDRDLFCPAPFILCDEFNIWHFKAYLEDIFKSAEKSYSFFYIGSVDSTGHSYTWCNWAYNFSVGVADRQIGIVLDAVDKSSVKDDVVLIVNADHGGEEYGHGRHTDNDVHVPMFIWGSGIKKGHQFQRDVNNEDIVPTVADMLGLKANPYWTGRVMDDAYEDED